MRTDSVFEMCKQEFEYIQKLRRQIHQNPETGFDVFETANLIANELSLYGFKVKTQVGKSGVIADLEVPAATRRIALRADMDALPMQEMNTHSFCSKNPGKAHMCGHDAHTAMLLGAARILSKNRERLKQNIRFLFQPNEENFPGGAPAMIAEGCLDGVDEIYGMHVWPLIPVKEYGLHAGPTMGRPDTFRIHIEGLGGHASIPHKAIDPIIAGAQLVGELQTIISRNISFDEFAVLSVTQFHAGTTHNVIPDKAFVEGTIRTFSEERSQFIQTRMKEILHGLEKSQRVRTEFELEPGYPVLVNVPENIKYTERCLLQLFPDRTAQSFKVQPSLGGEDFAYYLQKIPGCYVFLGCANKDRGITQICHDPRFDIDEECLVYGTALHVQWALGPRA